MSTHRTTRPSGSTYIAASYRAQESPSASPDPSARRGAHAAPPRSRPDQGPPAATPRPRPGRIVDYEPHRYEPGGESDGFPPMEPLDPDPPGRRHAVPGQRGTGAAAARPRRRVPVAVGVLAVVSVLCVGGGAAYLVFTGERSPTGRPAAVGSPSAVESVVASPSGTPAATTPPATRPPAGGEEEVSGDLSTFKKGDCLTVDEANDNRVGKVTCAGPGAQKVLLRKGGTLDDSVCQTVNATFSLSQDGPGSTRDFVLCVGPAD